MKKNEEKLDESVQEDIIYVQKIGEGKEAAMLSLQHQHL